MAIRDMQNTDLPKTYNNKLINKKSILIKNNNNKRGL